MNKEKSTTRKVRPLMAGYKKMSQGGDPNQVSSATTTTPFNVNGAISAGAGLAGGLVDTVAPADAWGVRSNGSALGSGALKGAAAGAMFGPEGALIGAGIGAVTGLLGNKKAQKAKNLEIKSENEQEDQIRQQRSANMIAANPNLKYGNLQASYYEIGGTMKGTGPTPPRTKRPLPAVMPKQRVMPSIAMAPGKQMNSSMAAGGKIVPPQYNLMKMNRPYKNYPFSKMTDGGHTFLTSDPSYSHPELVMGANGGQKMPKGKLAKAMAMKQAQMPVQIQGPGQVQAPVPGMISKANGGKVVPLSSQDAKVEGPSHAEGGVKIPQAGVELEGDETVNNGFVFSKKLGFAQEHEKIAKAQGKVEKKPATIVNQNTLKALDRQTQLLKVAQEATKKRMGLPNDIDATAEEMQAQQQGGNAIPSTGKMANGGKLARKMDLGGDGPKKPTSLIAGNLPANDDPYWKTHPLQTMHSDGTVRTWGEKLPPLGSVPNKVDNTTMAPIGTQPVPPILPSDKATGTSGVYYPARSQQTSKAVASILPNYKMGGKLYKKMVTGGRGAIIPDAKSDGVTMPGLDLPTTLPNINLGTALNGTAGQTQASGKGKININDAIDKAAPFISNVTAAFRKLPLPPVPVKESEVAPNLVDYSASKADAVRATRSANKAAEQNLSGGAAVTAARAANLSGQNRSTSQISEAETLANAQIRNSNNAENIGVRARNNTLTNNYNSELTARTLKQQDLISQNLNNISEKIQGMQRDKKMFDLEDQKVMLGALQDTTGASFRGAKGIFSKHLSPEDYKALEDHFNKLGAEDAADRASQRAITAAQIENGKNQKISPLMDKYKSTSDIMGKYSTVSTAAERKAEKQASVKKEEVN